MQSSQRETKESGWLHQMGILIEVQTAPRSGGLKASTSSLHLSALNHWNKWFQSKAVDVDIQFKLGENAASCPTLFSSSGYLSSPSNNHGSISVLE